MHWTAARSYSNEKGKIKSKRETKNLMNATFSLVLDCQTMQTRDNFFRFFSGFLSNILRFEKRFGQ